MPKLPNAQQVSNQQQASLLVICFLDFFSFLFLPGVLMCEHMVAKWFVSKLLYSRSFFQAVAVKLQHASAQSYIVLTTCFLCVWWCTHVFTILCYDCYQHVREHNLVAPQQRMFLVMYHSVVFCLWTVLENAYYFVVMIITEFQLLWKLLEEAKWRVECCLRIIHSRCRISSYIDYWLPNYSSCCELLLDEMNWIVVLTFEHARNVFTKE